MFSLRTLVKSGIVLMLEIFIIFRSHKVQGFNNNKLGAAKASQISPQTGEWVVETVDTNGGYSLSLALDSKTHPYMTYLRDNNSGGVSTDLRRTYFTGTKWESERIEELVPSHIFTSLQLNEQDLPRVAYFRYWQRDLGFAFFDGTKWNIELVDTNRNVGMSASLRLDSKDLPRIAYWDDTNERVKYARFNGSDWLISVVFDMTCSIAPPRVSLALDSHNRPHISFNDCGERKLKYAYLPGGAEHQVKAAYFNGQSWLIDIVDDAGAEGEFGDVSLKVDSDGVSHLAYWDAAGDLLKYATRPQYKLNTYLPAIVQNSP